MEENVKSFLDKIEELKEVKSKVQILSTGKEVECSVLTFKQQKDLISTIADGSVGSIKFTKIINDIIIANTGNNDIKVSDKLPIILKLRIDSIGKIYKFDQEELDLEKVLEKAKKLKLISTKTIGDQIKVELDAPTLAQENKVIQTTIDIVKKDGDDELGKSIGNIYTYEIVKYIKSVKFDDLVLNFQDIPIKDRYKIVDKLPLSLNKDIILFIQDIKAKEVEVLTLMVDNVEKTIDIDVSFFDS
jgi:hypothetical protein